MASTTAKPSAAETKVDKQLSTYFNPQQISEMGSVAQKQANLKTIISFLKFYENHAFSIDLSRTTYSFLPTGQLQIHTAAPESLIQQVFGKTGEKIAQGIGIVGTILVAPAVGGAELAGGGAATVAGSSTAGEIGSGGVTATAAGGTAAGVTAGTTAGTVAGKVASSVTGSVAKDLTAASLIALVTSLGFWTRVAEVILGGALLLLGLRAMTTGNTSIPVPG